MSATKLFGMIKQGWTLLVDPEREKRVQEAVSQMDRMLASQKRSFDLEKALRTIELDPKDVPDVCLKLYEKCLHRAWRDNQLTDAEIDALQWIAKALRLDSKVVQKARTQKGTEVFGELLAKAISDGTISPEERNQLDSVAKTLGMSVRDVVQAYFVRTAEGFLRAIFTRAIEDGLLIQDEWQRFLEAAVQLGFTQAEARKLVQPYSQQFVEHVLTDAKADGKLSERESQSLKWLLDQFTLTSEFRRYVTAEVQSLRAFTDIQEGRLPVLNDFRLVELRAGEIPHAHVRANYQFTRQRKSGDLTELHEGTLTITDTRTVFSSPQKSFHLNHAQVLMCLPVAPGLVEIRTGASKGAGFYSIEDHPELLTAIWKTALGRANQTIVEKITELPGRHIARDVRQRVWQRYGGRCAECQSDQYLEYDHVIPVAKGGSNGENNVQLLCRRCNLKKSDRI